MHLAAHEKLRRPLTSKRKPTTEQRKWKLFVFVVCLTQFRSRLFFFSFFLFEKSGLATSATHFSGRFAMNQSEKPVRLPLRNACDTRPEIRWSYRFQTGMICERHVSNCVNDDGRLHFVWQAFILKIPRGFLLFQKLFFLSLFHSINLVDAE